MRPVSWHHWQAVMVLGLGLAICSRAVADPPAGKQSHDAAYRAAAAFYEGIRTETLPNGLRIYLKPIPEAATVTTMMAYQVGSCDEDLEHTGLSHYLEHLMFKGTDKLMPGDIDRITLRNGGQNNAYTTEDYTIYHFDFARENWEAALAVEADRMRNLRIDLKHEFDKEKGAVINELLQDEDSPWDLETKAILPLLFGKSGPYGHPVIGVSEHVRGATAAVIQRHYNQWYHPNNAAFIVCGGFDPEQALAKIKKLFGGIDRGQLPPRKRVAENPSLPVRKAMEARSPMPRLLMGFPTVSSIDPDFLVLDVIQALLAGGKTGRLYSRLVEGAAVAGDVNAISYGGRYPGWFAIQVELLQGVGCDKVEKLVLAELQRLREQPVGAAELKRVQQKLLADAIFSRESVHGLADSIARGIMTNDLDYLKKYLPRISTVTTEDIQKVAGKYLDPKRLAAVWSVPKKEGDKAARKHLIKYHARSRQPKEQVGPGSSVLSFKNVQRVELPNGLVLLLCENHRLPMVAVEAHVGQVDLREYEEKAGVATLTGYLLSEGTSRHTGVQIAELMEDGGGILSMNASGGSVRVLTTQRSMALRLLFECLSEAVFPLEAFKRQRDRLLANIADTEHQPDVRAETAFHYLVYGRHPLGRPSLGYAKTVAALTPEDCLAFYRRLFVPNNTVVAITGDFDSKSIIQEITQLTEAWKKVAIPKLKLPAIEKLPRFSQHILTMPHAAQVHVYLGHQGIRRDNPDYYKLLVMDYVLGTGPGFTDRLSARLRDRMGLGYTVSAQVTATAGQEPGVFKCYIGTNPAHFEQVKKIFMEELRRIRDHKPTEQEVEDAKKYLIYNQPLQLTTNEQVARRLLLIERYHLGWNYNADYRKAVAAVSADDVQAVAKKYIDLDHMVLVAAGPIDARTGKPLVPIGAPMPEEKK